MRAPSTSALDRLALFRAAALALVLAALTGPAFAADEIEEEPKGDSMRALLRDHEETIVCGNGYREIDGECVKEVARKKSYVDFTDVQLEGDISRPSDLYVVSKPKTDFECDIETMTLEELSACWEKKAAIAPAAPTPETKPATTVQQTAMRLAEDTRRTLQCPEYKDIAPLLQEASKIAAFLKRTEGPSMEAFFREPKITALRETAIDRKIPIACGYPESLSKTGELPPFATNFFCTDEQTCFLQSPIYKKLAGGKISLGEMTRKDCEQYTRSKENPWRWQMAGESCVPHRASKTGEYTLIPLVDGVFIQIFHDKERKVRGSVGLLMADPHFEEAASDAKVKPATDVPPARSDSPAVSDPTADSAD